MWERLKHSKRSCRECHNNAKEDNVDLVFGDEKCKECPWFQIELSEAQLFAWKFWVERSQLGHELFMVLKNYELTESEAFELTFNLKVIESEAFECRKEPTKDGGK